QFLSEVKRTSRSPSEYLVVSYHRGTLGQTGTGHFSPVGGYNEKENMVLILDVARFKYPAYWVSVDLIWDSLLPIDKDTGKPRGYVVLSKGKRGYVQGAISQLAVNRDSWPELAQILFKELPTKVRSLSASTTIEEYITLVISSIPDEYYSVVEDRLPLFVTHILQSTGPEENGGATADEQAREYIAGLNELLRQLSQTELYRLIASSVAAKRKIAALEEQISNAPLLQQPQDGSSVNAAATAVSNTIAWDSMTQGQKPSTGTGGDAQVVEGISVMDVMSAPQAAPAAA
ncbi:hypothetical protein HK102_009006, partial [Quaeritorhiza haematococci]